MNDEIWFSIIYIGLAWVVGLAAYYTLLWAVDVTGIEAPKIIVAVAGLALFWWWRRQ